MNKSLHRLIFSRRLGMRVAVAETARSCGKVAAAGTVLAAGVLAVTAPALAQTPARPPVVFGSKAANKPAPTQLPKPYANSANKTFRPFAYDPAKGPGTSSSPNDLAAQGLVSWTVNGSSAVFDQGQVPRVVVNWDSFDIGSAATVEFRQSSDTGQLVSALNRIWSADPSVIMGTLKANREVILLNANGVYFGRGARVDTGRFVAAANSLADAVFEKGLRNVTDGSSVFTAPGDGYPATDATGGPIDYRNAVVSVEDGALIRAAAGGDVLLIAPRVTNAGRIETPKGQTVLAAGEKVYLMSSSDSAQRGLIVAVDPFKLGGSTQVDETLGVAENQANGSFKTVGGGTVDDSTPDTTAGLVKQLNEIRADSGTVNLVGLLVRQQGQINATTAVKGANGSIHLQAMGSTVAAVGGTAATTPASRRGWVTEDGSTVRLSAGGGSVEIGAGSVTAVLPSGDGATQLDAEVFNKSRIRVEGESIAVGSGARVEAPSGKVELLAASNRLTSALFDSGLVATLPPTDDSRIVIAPDAFINVAGLAGVQVDGERNQASLRLFRIELADAPVQRDGPLYRGQVYFDLRDGSKVTVADVSAAAASIGRTARERSTAGGELRVAAENAVVVGEGARLDVSGGSLHYSAATIESSLLVRDGHVIAFSNAKAGVSYEALRSDRLLTTVPAYDEGRDGGSLLLDGRRLALAGSLTGQVLEGERQRAGTSPRAAPASLTVGRTLGGGYSLAGVELGGAAAPLDQSLFANPLTAALDALPATAVLSLDAVAQGGFGALALRADEVTQPLFGRLDLGIKGSLDILARTVALDGEFAAPGGSVAVATTSADGSSAATGLGDIGLSGRTRLDTAGRWTNDTRLSGTAGDEPLQLAGGKVTLTAAHSVLAQPGAVIDVSGGARLSGSGSFSSGSAGSISVSAGRSVDFATELRLEGVALRGFDFGAGGTLTLGTPALTVGAADAGALTLAPAFFSSGGFGSITLNAYGDVRVASGTLLAPELQTWQLSTGYRTQASGAMRAAVAVPAAVDEALADRKPVNVTLAASAPLNPGLGQPGASVIIERGAGISLEAGGSLTLSATRDIEVGVSGGSAGQAALLQAPGGTLRLAITGLRGAASATTPGEDPAGFLRDQVLWIGSDALLSVGGVAELRTLVAPSVLTTSAGGANDAGSLQGRLTGTVLGGGLLALEAQRGYVVVDQGARLNLDGAVAALNLPGLDGPTTVAKAAGTLKVSSPEGIVLDGSISARPPRDAAGLPLADGGRLDVAVGLYGVNSFTAGAAYETALRQLVVDDRSGIVASSGARFGGDLSVALGNGTAYLPASLLTGSGFDALRLGAGDRIRFDTSVSAIKPLAVVLDAPAVAAKAGVDVELGGSYVSIGDRAIQRQGTTEPDRDASLPAPGSAATWLRLRADTIEVVGQGALQGYTDVTFEAGSEIRFSSIFSTNLYQLDFAGVLTLSASQIYATTGTRFALAGLAAADEADAGSRLVLRTGPQGAAAMSPLSVFGSLSLSATSIDHGGVLRQPFGALSLSAERGLELRAGSITSVSGDGATLLYGTTTNLSDWQAATGASLTQLPVEKSIQLRAATLTTSPQARVDASGGGAVKAWEFFAGVGGSSDYFLSDGLYAVLPDYATTATLALTGSGLDISNAGRELVVTMAGSGLAPGAYTLMPARLALLAGDLPQGAFLVRRASDQGSAVLGAPLRQDDGSVVVTGYTREVGSAAVGAPGERFVVESATTFGARSDIRLTDISSFLAQRAALLGNATPALPQDGGRVQLATTGSQQSLWQAGLALGAADGKGGTLDVTATRVVLVDDLLTRTPADALGLSADSVERSGAGSVLLGGVRKLTASTEAGVPVYAIDASGTSVAEVDLRSRPLNLEELLLATSGTLTIAADSRIVASGPSTLGARALTLSGDGAFAAVSANPLQLSRSGAALASGQLVLGAASTLSGAQVELDATASLQLAASAVVSTAQLGLGARRIVVGSGTDADPLTTVLDDEVLASAREASALSLRSYTSIDFVGSQDWAARDTAGVATRVLDRLILDAPAVRGLAPMGGGQTLTDIAARSIVIRNSSGRTASGLTPGEGALVLQALPALQYGVTGGLTLGPGQVRLAYADATLRSQGDIVLAGTGGADAQGDLSLVASRLTAATGAVQSLTAAAGILSIEREPLGRTLGERVGQGADVSFSARRIDQSGWLDLPGSRLSLLASGDGGNEPALRFGAGSLSSVAGFNVQATEGFVAYGSAGSLSARAETGTIAVLGTLDASAARHADGSAGQGDAGSITLAASGAGGGLLLQGMAADGSAVSGRLRALAGSAPGDRGGQLDVDVATMPSADALAVAATAGGMTREFSLRVRSGDLQLATGLQAERIGIAADAGALTIAGAALRADSESGGVVQLAAAGDLKLEGGTRIDAHSSRPGASGGDVLLASSTGHVRLASDAQVEAGGDDANDGRIVLRALRTAGGVQVGALNAANLRAAEVDLEAVRVYGQVTVGAETRDIATIGSGNSAIAVSGGVRTGTLGQASVLADSNAYMTAAAGTLARLGVGADDSARFHLRAGVEVRAAGNLTVRDDWALNAARPGGDAGFLTLRAAGQLLVNGSISDGFTAATATVAGTGAAVPLNDNARSWSYRLTAGADLSSAGLLSTLGVDKLSSAGDLSIAAGKLVRTGAGSIEVAAGRDLLFGSGTAAVAPGEIYVAGRKVANQTSVLSTLFGSQTAKPAFTEQGGRLALTAGRDIRASESTQLINNWFWRSGLAANATQYSTASQLAWWTEFSRFRQTVGAFGGGGLHVEAGRDIVNLQAMVPTAGWADSRLMAEATLQRVGGGDLEVRAGRDLLGGQYFVAAGEGRLSAGRTLGEAAGNTRIRHTVLAQMDGADWRLSARDGLTAPGSVNPTALPASSSDSRAPVSGYFYTWGDGAALRMTANAGLLTVVGTPAESALVGLGLFGESASARFFAVWPGTLTATAFGGDVSLLPVESLGAVLFPSAHGQLAVLASGSVSLGSASSTVARLAMADSDVLSWPSAAQPVSRVSNPITAEAGLVVTTLNGTASQVGLHAGDGTPATIVAGDEIRTYGNATLRLAKPVELVAGTDILGLRLVTQNLSGSDVTTLSAGRNFLAGELGLVELGGPGGLEISAGSQIDLANSAGVATVGNQGNPSLPAEGASIRMQASTAGSLDLATLEQNYLADAAAGGSERSATYRDALLEFVRAGVGEASLDYPQALALFRRFPAQAQARFGRQVLAAEFGQVYLESALPTAADYTATLRSAFDRRKADILEAGDQALAAGQSLLLPGRESLGGVALASYLAELRGLSFDQLDLDATVSARLTSLAAVRSGWKAAVAASLGRTPGELEALAAARPDDPLSQAWREGLASRSGAVFDRYRLQTLQAEAAATGAAASLFGKKSLPMRLALLDQGFLAAELAGAGNFTARPIWPGARPLLSYAGSIEMTQSGMVTQRGGDISLISAGGGINVGLKETATPKGVITLGGGDVFGFSLGDFQVNTQRVAIVGNGDIGIWSTSGDIDSGRGANTAVAAPPLTARRSADGIVFEVSATTTGKGIAILEDAQGRRAGSVGLYPAFGEILALDAFIRAPSVVLGANVQGADNLIATSVGGAAAPVAAPTVSVTAPPSTQQTARVGEVATGAREESRPRNSLLTVELLGMGQATAPETCSEEDERARRCSRKPAPPCPAADAAKGLCK